MAETRPRNAGGAVAPEGRADKSFPDCRTCPVSGYGIYAATMKTAPDRIPRLRAGVSAYEANQAMLVQGQSSERIGSLRSGWAYVHKTLQGGRRHILAFLLPGDLVGIDLLAMGRNPLPYGTTALNDASVCWFDTEAFHELLQAEGAQRSATQFWMSLYVSTFSLRTAMIGHATATARLAEFVLELFVRLRHRNLTRGDGYEFLPTQSQVADCLGLTPAYVSMTLTRLRKRGILEIRDRTLRVLDERELHRIANAKDSEPAALGTK